MADSEVQPFIEETAASKKEAAAVLVEEEPKKIDLNGNANLNGHEQNGEEGAVEKDKIDAMEKEDSEVSVTPDTVREVLPLEENSAEGEQQKDEEDQPGPTTQVEGAQKEEAEDSEKMVEEVESEVQLENQPQPIEVTEEQDLQKGHEEKAEEFSELNNEQEKDDEESSLVVSAEGEVAEEVGDLQAETNEVQEEEHAGNIDRSGENLTAVNESLDKDEELGPEPAIEVAEVKIETQEPSESVMEDPSGEVKPSGPEQDEQLSPDVEVEVQAPLPVVEQSLEPASELESPKTEAEGLEVESPAPSPEPVVEQTPEPAPDVKIIATEVPEVENPEPEIENQSPVPIVEQVGTSIEAEVSDPENKLPESPLDVEQATEENVSGIEVEAQAAEPASDENLNVKDEAPEQAPVFENVADDAEVRSHLEVETEEAVPLDEASKQNEICPDLDIEVKEQTFVVEAEPTPLLEAAEPVACLEVKVEAEEAVPLDEALKEDEICSDLDVEVKEQTFVQEAEPIPLVEAAEAEVCQGVEVKTSQPEPVVQENASVTKTEEVLYEGEDGDKITKEVVTMATEKTSETKSEPVVEEDNVTVEEAKSESLHCNVEKETIKIGDTVAAEVIRKTEQQSSRETKTSKVVSETVEEMTKEELLEKFPELRTQQPSSPTCTSKLLIRVDGNDDGSQTKTEQEKISSTITSTSTDTSGTTIITINSSTSSRTTTTHSSSSNSTPLKSSTVPPTPAEKSEGPVSVRTGQTKLVSLVPIQNDKEPNRPTPPARRKNSESKNDKKEKIIEIKPAEPEPEKPETSKPNTGKSEPASDADPVANDRKVAKPGIFGSLFGCCAGKK